MRPLRIISGGQTGVDRAALDVARALGLPYGGYVPRGRWTEDGPLSPQYEGMVETEHKGPSDRTERNVTAADATLVITRGSCEGGTGLTVRKARAIGKPLLIVDLDSVSAADAALRIRDWLAAIAPRTLNVGGPRASEAPSLYAEARAILIAALGDRGEPPAALKAGSRRR